jgi:type IV pilus assembly protein PilO
MLSKITTPLFEFIEKLPKTQRIALCAGVFVLVVGLFGWLSIYPEFSDIQRLKTEVEDLDRTLTIAKRKAGQLDKYRKMLEKDQAALNIAKKALPEKKEIPSLLTGISRAGKTAGLEFYLFAPLPEVKREFYAEIPVGIKVKGTYHNMAVFFDKVSRLFRVVNITDIVMQKDKSRNILDTSCKAITYRFLEKEAAEKVKAKNAKKKK